MSGMWGTLSLGFLTVPGLADKLATGKGGLFYGAACTSSASRPSVSAAVGGFTFGASFLVLLLFKLTIGIRTEPEVESAGLDVSEHGMWGYPEFYIPVPGGYGTEASHGAHAPALGPATVSRHGHDRAHRLGRDASGGSTTGPPDPPSAGASEDRPPLSALAADVPGPRRAAITRAGRALRPSSRRRRAGPRP